MAQRNEATSPKRVTDPHSPVREVVFGPFGGYVPNAPGNAIGTGVDSALLDFRAATQLTGFVPRGEELAPDYGWQRHDPTQMPLGGYINGGGPAPSGTGQPVVHIVHIPSTVSPNSVEENLAITAKAGGTNGTVWQYPSYLAPATWAALPSIAGGATGGADAIVTSSADVWDSAVYQPGHTVLLCDGIGIAYSGQQVGLLRYYTGRTWGQFPRPSGVVTSFGCVSVCSHQDRVLVLGTIEDGVLKPNRIRWTTAGWSTALASPITLPSANLWNDAGAGALDVEEEVGYAVAIRPIANNIACYFKQGLVILERTGEFTRPYRRTVVTTRRGLLGTQAITDVGNGVHFGVFTDGWFFMGQDGQFKEVGTTEAQGTTIRKWAQAFYDRLNGPLAYQVLVSYEPSRHFIKIAFPDGDESTSPNTVWTYDIYGDRVWPDNYALSVGDKNPLSWGETIALVDTSSTWDAAAGTWNDSLNVWAGTSVLPTLFSHGTVDGVVYQHTPNLITRDGELPTFQYVSAPQACGDPSQFKQFQQALIHYMKVGALEGAASSIITVSLLDGRTGEVVASRACTLQSGNTKLPEVLQAWFRNPLVQVQISIVGTHPFVLRGFELQWLPNMGDVR